MPLQTQVVRNAGHPWDGRQGFDLLHVQADTDAEMRKFVAGAQKKFWQPWLIGVCENTQLPGGVLFKPCDIDEPWVDSPECPHPGRPRVQPA